jgi:hypothetical protein
MPTPTVTPTPTPGSRGITRTTLSVVGVPLPFRLGGFAIPIAYLTPRNVAGTVQFNDGTARLGDPVPVVGGVAIGPLTSLPVGRHSIIATFIPTKPAVFESSMSDAVVFMF